MLVAQGGHTTHPLKNFAKRFGERNRIASLYPVTIDRSATPTKVRPCLALSNGFMLPTRNLALQPIRHAIVKYQGLVQPKDWNRCRPWNMPRALAKNSDRHNSER